MQVPKGGRSKNIAEICFVYFPIPPYWRGLESSRAYLSVGKVKYMYSKGVSIILCAFYNSNNVRIYYDPPTHRSIRT